MGSYQSVEPCSERKQLYKMNTYLKELHVDNAKASYRNMLHRSFLYVDKQFYIIMLEFIK